MRSTLLYIYNYNQSKTLKIHQVMKGAACLVSSVLQF